MWNLNHERKATTGDIFDNTEGKGVAVGQLHTKDLVRVASVGAGAALTDVQGLPVYGPGRQFRIRGVAAAAGAITGAATFALYTVAGTPANILAAAQAFGAAGVQVLVAPADPTVVYPAGQAFTLRVTTAASTGALTDVAAQIEFEILPPTS